MRNISRFGALFIALAMLVAGPQGVRGNTVFSQLPVNGAFSPISDGGASQQAADNFSLSGANTIVSLRWWGVWDNFPLASANFGVRFFNDNGSGAPLANAFSSQNVLNVTPVATAFTYGGKPVWQFTSNLAGVNLSGATPYYLSLVENTTTISDWQWAGDSAGSHFRRSLDGQSWNTFSSGGNLAFQLNNNLVPLPPAVWAGLALIGGIAVQRKLAKDTNFAV